METKMHLHEIWTDDDNKKIRGKPDAVFVSLTEPYELRYFMESILNEAGKGHTDANKQAVLNAVNSFSGKPPILRSALRAHVLNVIQWPVAKLRP
jgi:hypothetical protein